MLKKIRYLTPKSQSEPHLRVFNPIQYPNREKHTSNGKNDCTVDIIVTYN